MEWSGVVTNQIPLFGFVKNKWSGMEPNGTHFITFHSILLFSFPLNLGCMEWNVILKIKYYPFVHIFDLLLVTLLILLLYLSNILCILFFHVIFFRFIFFLFIFERLLCFFILHIKYALLFWSFGVTFFIFFLTNFSFSF
jgi:hypothetical protein